MNDQLPTACGTTPNSQAARGSVQRLVRSHFYTLKKDIVIPAGTEIHSAPTEIKRHTPYGEIIVGFEKDYWGSFSISEETLENNPDLFNRENL